MKIKNITPRLFIAALALLITHDGVAADKKQKPLRALLITGGCCHNYIFQSKALIDGVAKHAKMVYGFELIMSAVQNAMQNAVQNNVKNAWFFAGNLEHIFRVNQEAKDLKLPDVIIVDPPRAGLHQNIVQDILEKSPGRIVYVSCNPATQARDVAALCSQQYELIKLHPVDMFPHTPHVENVATLIRKK